MISYIEQPCFFDAPNAMFASGKSSPSAYEASFSAFAAEQRDILCFSPKPQPVSTCSQPEPNRLSPDLAFALEEMIQNGTFEDFMAESGLESIICPSQLSDASFLLQSDHAQDDSVFELRHKPSSSSMRRRHSISTPGSGDIKCCPFPGCERVFESSSSLTSHLRVHSQGRPHQCPHCEAAFSRGHDLRRHLNAVHELRKQEICCEGCQRTFSRQDALNRHLRFKACKGTRRF